MWQQLTNGSYCHIPVHMTTSAGLSAFEPQHVRSFAKQWEALFDAADAAGMAASYAEDALLVETSTIDISGIWVPSERRSL